LKFKMNKKILFCVYDAGDGVDNPNKIISGDDHGKIIAMVVDYYHIGYFQIDVDNPIEVEGWCVLTKETIELNELDSSAIEWIPKYLPKNYDRQDDWHVFENADDALLKSQELLEHKKDLVCSQKDDIYLSMEKLDLKNYILIERIKSKQKN